MNKKSSLDFLNLSVLLLSLYVLFALLVDTFYKLDDETSKLIFYFDFAICIFFLFEFFYRLYTAENKLKYLKWGWIDLLSSIPMVDFLRYGRILRVIRLLRIIRAFKSIQQFLDVVYTNKIKGTFSSAIILAVLLLIFSSISILVFEDDSSSNIKSAEDAIWWSYVTITTVGYGDLYPTTTEGRILGIILMTFGVGLFGIFTAYIASIFVGTRESQST